MGAAGRDAQGKAGNKMKKVRVGNTDYYVFDWVAEEFARLQDELARLEAANADLERDLVDALQRREYLVLDGAPVAYAVVTQEWPAVYDVTEDGRIVDLT